MREQQFNLGNYLRANNQSRDKLKSEHSYLRTSLKIVAAGKQKLYNTWRIIDEKEKQLKRDKLRPIKLLLEVDDIIADQIEACRVKKASLCDEMRRADRLTYALHKHRRNLFDKLYENNKFSNQLENKKKYLRAEAKKITYEIASLYSEWQISDKKVKQLCQMLGYSIKIVFCDIKDSPAKNTSCVNYAPQIFHINENTLNDHARRYGYYCYNVDADGNCFYRAVLDQLYQRCGKQYIMNTLIKEMISQHVKWFPHLHQNAFVSSLLRAALQAKLHHKLSERNINHITLRSFVCHHMETNAELYKNFFAAEDWEQINTPGVWAGQPEILAVARLFNLNVVVLKNDGDVDITKRAQAQGTICLGYDAITNINNNECAHYLSLRPDRAVVAEASLDDLVQKKDSFDTAYNDSNQTKNGPVVTSDNIMPRL